MSFPIKTTNTSKSEHSLYSTIFAWVMLKCSTYLICFNNFGCNPPKIASWKLTAVPKECQLGGTMRLFSTCELEVIYIEKENNAKATYAGRTNFPRVFLRLINSFTREQRKGKYAPLQPRPSTCVVLAYGKLLKFFPQFLMCFV